MRCTAVVERASLCLAMCLAISLVSLGPRPVSAGDVPPPTSGAACTVSQLLVPSCGAWFGASTPSRNGRYDYRLGLTEYEAITRNVPDILHFYKTGGARFPTADEVALSERPGMQPSLLFYNWKPSTALTWAAISRGAVDDDIATVATGLKAYPGRLFLAIHHEPENDQGGPQSGRTPADYVAMYRHVVTTLRAEGVDNVVYVMNFMGFAGWASVADEFYPGDDVVDWIAYDPYARGGVASFATLLNRPEGRWPGFYVWATRRAPGKPIMLGEWGFDPSTEPRAPDALDDAAHVLEHQFPMVKALVYWNNRTGEYDYRLDQQTDNGREFAAAFARLANHPYFNSTDVRAVDASDPPTDAAVTVTGPATAPASTQVPATAIADSDPSRSKPDPVVQPTGRTPSRTQISGFVVPLTVVAALALVAGVLVRRQRHERAPPGPG